MSHITELAQQARESANPNLLMEGIPYAKLLGMLMEPDGTFHLPPKRTNIGNPTLPALHGGALGGFMEMCGITHVMMAMEVIKVPKVVDFSIDYVRAGLFQDTYAKCEIVRFGRKLVNISVVAWQDDAAKPIARARAQLLID